MTITPLRKFITSYPEFFGALIGLVLILLVAVIVFWFPSINAAWDSHNALVRDIWCTQALFVVSLVQFWPLRRKIAFWVSIAMFFSLHILAISLYTSHVHPLLLSQWAVLGVVECTILFFLIPRSTRLFDCRVAGKPN